MNRTASGNPSVHRSGGLRSAVLAGGAGVLSAAAGLAVDRAVAVWASGGMAPPVAIAYAERADARMEPTRRAVGRRRERMSNREVRS